MKARIVKDDWGWVERITGALLLAAVICAVLLALSAGAASADDGTLPYKVRTTGRLSEVSCAGPCCCGTVSTIIGHVRYEASGYCRWFRPLRNGQTVTTMLVRTNIPVR